MSKNGIGRTKTLWVSVWGLASGGVDNFPHIIAQMTDYVKALVKFVSKNSIKFIEYADWDLIRLIFEDYGKD